MKHERGEKELVSNIKIVVCPPPASLALFTFKQITFVSPSESVFSIDLFHLDRSGKCGVKCLPLSSLQPLTDLIVLVSSISDINHIPA